MIEGSPIRHLRHKALSACIPLLLFFAGCNGPAEANAADCGNPEIPRFITRGPDGFSIPGYNDGTPTPDSPEQILEAQYGSCKFSIAPSDTSDAFIVEWVTPTPTPNTLNQGSFHRDLIP